MPRALRFLLVLLLAGGCSRMPKIIILEDPLTAAERVELGVAYERKGELDLARREYERALRKEKDHFQARFNLGNVSMAKKEYGQARDEYLRALEIRPGDADATNNLAWCAIFSGEEIEDALARMEAVVSGPAGRRPVPLDTVGVLRMRANRPGPAAEAFREAEKLCLEADEYSREPMQVDPGSPGVVSCPEDLRSEIREHRGELLKRFPAPSPPPALIR